MREIKKAILFLCVLMAIGACSEEEIVENNELEATYIEEDSLRDLNIQADLVANLSREEEEEADVE